MTQRRMFLWSSILLVGALSLTGCGGGGDDGAPAPAPTGSTVTKFATLDGTQAGVTTTANGTGSLTVDTGTGAVSGSLIIQSASATGISLAHVHEGAPGVAGGPFITLNGPAGSTSGTWTVPAGTVLDAAHITSFNAGNLYFAVHTTANPGGELRGQINQASTTLYARLDGTQANVATSATGTGSLTVNADTGAVSGSLTIGVAPATGISLAHVHQGDRGVAGGPFITLNGPTGSTSGTWSVPAGTVLSQTEKDLFIAGNLYFAVHTTANPGGELRGQIDLIAP